MRRILSTTEACVAAMVLCIALTAFAADAPVLQILSARPGATVEVDRLIGDGKAIVSVADEAGKPLFELGAADFTVSLGGREANVTSVQPLSESLDVPRHIVLMLDNSDSMRQRNAVKSLLASLDEYLKNIRPIDDVRIVTFSSKKFMAVEGRPLHAQTFKSNQPGALKAFAEKAYSKELTSGTYLYDGMLAAVDLIRKMPASEPRFMVVLSDGEDLNSSVKREEVIKAAKGAGRFSAYAIDYMPASKIDKFLNDFAIANHGQAYKAASESSFLSIFQSVATRMQYFYLIGYSFPLTGMLAVVPESVVVEEVKTIDSSPLLGHIFFAEGSSAIPSTYASLAGPAETAGFDDQKFTDTLEKYYQVLNIIGKRLADTPEAKITLVGCNSDTGKEKGKKKLSAQRAEAVKKYLQTVWNIAPGRMTIEARNLPALPSAKWQFPGQAENRRVEIRSTDPAALAPVRSVYLATRINAPALTVKPNGIVPEDIASWNIVAANAAGVLARLEGKGSPAPEQQIELPARDLKALAAGGDITVKMALKGKKGQALELSQPVKVSFVETSQRTTEKQDRKVQEKYALILFDFDKDTLGPLNQVIVNKVAERIKNLPGATAQIVGHTDNTGKDVYNIKLSERRALAVYKMLAAACSPEAAERIRHSGVGPKSPLYENKTPEARSFNRTVTITLEYLSAE